MISQLVASFFSSAQGDAHR